jgi:tRNA pseudouridine55 synthase
MILELALESGAHLTALRRTKIGDYSVENAISPDDFAQLHEDEK